MRRAQHRWSRRRAGSQQRLCRQCLTVVRADVHPAWRLHAIIARALTARDGTIRELWATAFETPAKDTATIFRRLALLHELVDEVEGTVHSVPNIDPDYYLQNLSSLRSAIAFTNLDKPASEVASLLHGLTHRDVGFWAHAIEGVTFSEALQEEELRGLIDEVTALFEEVRAAAIDSDLKDTVLDGLEGIRRAIVEYRLRGSEGLREEVERAIGKMARRAADLKGYAQDSWYKRVWRLLEKADDAATRGKKYLPLVRQLLKLLPAGVVPLLEE
jgi:hypothetical protein